MVDTPILRSVTLPRPAKLSVMAFYTGSHVPLYTDPKAYDRHCIQYFVGQNHTAETVFRQADRRRSFPETACEISAAAF